MIRWLTGQRTVRPMSVVAAVLLGFGLGRIPSTGGWTAVAAALVVLSWAALLDAER